MGGAKQCAVKFSTVTNVMGITAVPSVLARADAKIPVRTALGAVAKAGMKQCMS